MLLACPGVEISIYSTCKRISQKILRNVAKFAMMVADGDYKNLNFTVKRENMEEINLQGPLGRTDVRIINSYPSKVMRVYACLFTRQKSTQKLKVKSLALKNVRKEALCCTQRFGMLLPARHRITIISMMRWFLWRKRPLSQHKPWAVASAGRWCTDADTGLSEIVAVVKHACNHASIPRQCEGVNLIKRIRFSMHLH